MYNKMNDNDLAAAYRRLIVEGRQIRKLLLARGYQYVSKSTGSPVALATPAQIESYVFRKTTEVVL